MKQLKTIHRTGRIGFLQLKMRALLWLGLVGVSTSLWGQTETNFVVSGKVRDAVTKQPIVAALVRSTQNGTSAATDSAGDFKLVVLSATDVLVVTAFDHAARQVAVQGKQSIAIDMYTDGFKGVYRENETVFGKSIANQSVASLQAWSDILTVNSLSIDDQMNALNGAALRGVARSGCQGIGSSYFIQGINSVNANAQPLFIVDGVLWNSLYDAHSLHSGYFGNSLADIDPSDIESVTVLKDGTSIYGSKGSNGVVLIKTKRGTSMATKITANLFAGVTTKAESLPMMDGEEFRVYASDLYGSMGYTSVQFDKLAFLNQNTSIPSYNIYHNNTHWDDRVYQHGITRGFNVGVDGGDDRALYMFSFGYSNNKGVVKANDMQRLNMRFNADINMSKVLTLSANVGFTNTDRNLEDDGVNFYTSPSYVAMIKAPFFSPYKYTTSGGWSKSYDFYDSFGVSNPDGVIENSLNTNKHYRLSIGLKPTFKLTPTLTLSSLFDYSLDKVKENFFSPYQYVAPRYLNGYGYSYNMTRNQVMRNTALFNDTQLSFEKTYNKLHNLAAMFGWRYSNNYYEMDYVEGHNSKSNDKPNVKDAPDYRVTDGLNNKVNSISNYANVAYNYHKRYFINASVAVDGSSVFGSETKGGFQLGSHSWGVFPSVDGAYLVSSEQFMSKFGFINQLKLRAGYGLTGNDGIEPYASTAYFESSWIQPSRLVTLVMGNIANTELQWETTAKFHGGLDVSLFDEKLNLTADIYQSKTINLLMLRDLPIVAGKGQYWVNDGEMSNRGMELSTQVKVLNTKSLKWEMGASIGKYKNRIEKLDGGNVITNAYGAQILTAVGNSAGVFYGFKTKGVLNTEAAALGANLKMEMPDGNYAYFQPGDMFFDDYKADGTINNDDRQVIGDPNPDFYGSFNSKWVFGRFTLDALLTFSCGNDVYNYLRASLESGSQLFNQTTSMLNRWKYEGQITETPRALYGDPMGNARFSDRWIEDGSYLKVKSVSLNYQVPYQGNMIRGINVWASANNLFTFTKYLGRDPEVSVGNSALLQGIDTGLIPQTPSFFVGVKLNL